MTELCKSHQTVLDALKRPLTKLELKLITGQSPDGLRGRISELNKWEYDIVLKEPEIPEKKYHLISSDVPRILDWLEENGLFGQVVSYQAISKELGISTVDIARAMARIFKTHIVIQMTKYSVRVGRKEE